MAGGAAFSVGVFLWTQLSMLFYPGWGWASFRVYFYPDQLANFAMLVNGSRGNFASVEPFTETGTNNDPHLYFLVLGAISRFTGISPADVYNLGGVTLQIVFVLILSLGAAALTRRWWAAYLGAVPYLLGTLSFSGGTWSTTMQSHAVLWGPFGSMFALNGASASLAIAASLLTLLLVVATRSGRPRELLIVGVIVGAGIGLLANVDTYSFLSALYFALYGLSAFAMAVKGRWWPAAATVALVVLLFLTGPAISSSVGRLAVLVVGLVPALPGVVTAVVRWRMRVLWPMFALAAVAAPQVVSVLAALHAGSAFLKLREASSANLGVSWEDGLICSLPMVIPLVMIFVAGVHKRRPLWLAYSAGATTAWLLLAKNDVWGANQEPYQLWVDCFALTAFTILPIAIDVALVYLSPRRSQVERPARAWQAVIALLTILTVGVGAASSVDWYRFYKSQEGQTMSLSMPVDSAMKLVASRLTGDELVVTDPCVNSELFKVVTGARVDYYSLGLAWPARRTQIDAVTAALEAGVLKLSELKAAGIGWMVTEGACATNWPTHFSGLLTRKATGRYGSSPSDVVTLWRLETVAGADKNASG
jgi:hypothetical protein